MPGKMDKKTKHSSSLVSAAAKAIAGGKEALTTSSLRHHQICWNSSTLLSLRHNP